MSVVSKFFGIWMLNRTVSSTAPLFLRLLLGMAAFAVCVMVATMIIMMLVAALVWLAYGQLIASGLDSSHAVLLLAGGLLAVLAALIATAKSHLIKIRRSCRTLVHFNTPGMGKFHHLIDAFLHGYEGRP